MLLKEKLSCYLDRTARRGAATEQTKRQTSNHVRAVVFEETL